MRTKLTAFKIGDRVELLRYYSFEGDPPPKGTVVSIGLRRVDCKIDSHGRVIGFAPSDLSIVGKMGWSGPAKIGTQLGTRRSGNGGDKG